MIVRRCVRLQDGSQCRVEEKVPRTCTCTCTCEVLASLKAPLLSTSPIPIMRKSVWHLQGLLWEDIKNVDEYPDWDGGLWAKQDTPIEKKEFRSRGSFYFTPYPVQNCRETLNVSQGLG